MLQSTIREHSSFWIKRANTLSKYNFNSKVVDSELNKTIRLHHGGRINRKLGGHHQFMTCTLVSESPTSSINFVTSYTLSWMTIHSESALLCLATSSHEYLGSSLPLSFVVSPSLAMLESDLSVLLPAVKLKSGQVFQWRMHEKGWKGTTILAHAQ